MSALIFVSFLFASAAVFEPQPICRYHECLAELDEFQSSPFFTNSIHTISIFGVESPFKIDLTLLSGFGLDASTECGELMLDIKRHRDDSLRAFTNAYSMRGTGRFSRLGLAFSRPIKGAVWFDGSVEFFDRSTYGQTSRHGLNLDGRLRQFAFNVSYFQTSRRNFADSSFESFRLGIRTPKFGFTAVKFGSRQWLEHVDGFVWPTPKMGLRFEVEGVQRKFRYGGWLDWRVLSNGIISCGVRRNSPYLWLSVRNRIFAFGLGYRALWRDSSIERYAELRFLLKPLEPLAFHLHAVGSPDFVSKKFQSKFVGARSELNVPLYFGINAFAGLGVYHVSDSLLSVYLVEFKRPFNLGRDNLLEVKLKFYGKAEGLELLEASGEFQAVLLLFRSVKIIWRERFDRRYTFTISANFLN